MTNAAVTLKAMVHRVLPYGWAGRLGWIARYGIRDVRAYVPREVFGFSHDREQIALYRLMRSLPRDAQVLEIGSWLGRSSIAIAKGLRGDGAKLFCVDLFAGPDGAGTDVRARNEFELVLGLRDQRTEFERNLARNRVVECVSTIAGRSHDVALGWNQPLDAVFIDGNHDYAAVCQDILDWSRHLKVGGWLILHDVWFDPPANREIDYRGPARAVTELVLDHPEWSNSALDESLFRVQKIKAPIHP